jgi:FkbM family methyltransferase
MVSRELFNKIGLLNEYYGKGAGEDTEFCVEAERAGYNVCQALDTEWSFEIGTNTGHFPIYHKGEGTVHDTVLVPDWSDVFLQNSLKLAKKYNIDWFREQLKTIPPTNLFWLECGSMSNQTDYKQTIINDRFRIKTENFNGREVVDVGAKRGIFSILSASKGASKVHAIEPLTKNYGELLQNIAFSKFSNVIFPVQKFGGSKSEHHLEFLKTKSNSDLTNLDEDYTSIGAISMTEIAQLVNSPNSVLKVDCDGCEYDLFLNASQADLKNFSYIVLEEYQDLNPNCQNYCVLEQRIFDLGFYMDYCTQALPHVQNFKEKMSNQVLPFKTTFWRRRETISE